MNCLFLLADNYPYSGACTSLLKNLFFNGNLEKSIDCIEVLACKKELCSLKSVCVDGITVHDFVFLPHVSFRKCKAALAKHPVMAIRGIAKKLLLKLNSKEIKSDNVNSAKRALKNINAWKFDVIVAVMGSFDVAAAAMIYKKNNPDIKLVVYQVDPCSTNEVSPSSTKKERLNFEKKLYEISDKIINTPILFEESKALYTKEIIDKMIPMEFPNVVPVEDDNSKNNADIRCLFTGNIYGNFRDPKYTLRLFDKVDSSIKFEVIGSVKPEVKSEFAQHSILYHGPKPLEETKSELKKANVLVNIGNGMLNQVPSKLFEYISYGKPIVNICKNRDCPTLPYLADYPYVLNLFEEDELFEEQVKKLNDFILENHSNRMTPEEITNAFETCTPQYCAKQMLGVFNSFK